MFRVRVHHHGAAQLRRYHLSGGGNLRRSTDQQDRAQLCRLDLSRLQGVGQRGDGRLDWFGSTVAAEVFEAFRMPEDLAFVGLLAHDRCIERAAVQVTHGHRVAIAPALGRSVVGHSGFRLGHYRGLRQLRLARSILEQRTPECSPARWAGQHDVIGWFTLRRGYLGDHVPQQSAQHGGDFVGCTTNDNGRGVAESTHELTADPIGAILGGLAGGYRAVTPQAYHRWGDHRMVSQRNHLGSGACPRYRGRNERSADVDPEAIAHRSSTENKPTATYTAHE
jgi:hypothetical protein